MRKIYSFMVGAVAMFAAVSCAQELSQNDQLPEGEVVVFEATVDGADTKAVLDGKVSKWENGDKITIHNGTKGYEFATTDEGVKANFSYTGDDFAGDKFLAVYPAGKYTADVEAKTVNTYIPTYQKAHLGDYPTYSGNDEVTATLAIAYSENQSLQFKNACALLKFNVANPNITHVKFYGNNEDAITGNMLVTLDENNDIKSVLGQKTTFTWDDNTTSEQFGTWVEMHAYEGDDNKYFEPGDEKFYYLAVAPYTFTKGFAVKVKIDGEEHEIKKYDDEYTIKPNTILNLGTLKYDPNKVDASAYGVVGSFQGWDVANPVAMKYVSDGWIVAENVELYKDDEFKFAKDKSWDVSYGTSTAHVLKDGEETTVTTTNGQNMRVAKNGKYKLHFNPNANKVKVECIEEYTDLMVNITIDNKANWSPLYIYLESNGTALTAAQGDLVTGNVYEISGDYIGETLSYKFISGSNSTSLEDVNITKTGAKIILEKQEEEKPKLYLKPNSNWTQSDAWFAAYFFGNGEKWVKMKDEDKDGIYELDLPSGYPNVIFCRMNPSSTTLNWGSKWDQTKDLVIPTDGRNLFTVANGAWNNASGTWSTK